jgi:hypothetical protein
MRASEVLVFTAWITVAACAPVRSSRGQHPDASSVTRHTVGPDGVTSDRADMERRTMGLLNGIKKWNSLTQTIDSVRVAGDTAFVIMSQYLDRMGLRPDNQVHHVETWATQRETWIRLEGRWFLWRVDQVRNQRRLVDGRAG